MRMDQVMKALKHWYSRQEEEDAQSAFRFAMVVGPDRKPIDADYEASRPLMKKKRKSKGKARQRDELDGLLQITQHDVPVPEAGMSRAASTEATEELVDIDMEQMLALKRMGYMCHGPINGPNEGFPLYQAPKLWVQQLSISRPRPQP